MRSGGLVTALIAIAACRATAGITSVDGMDVRVAFDDFKAQYGKTYGSAAEDARRFAIFEANLRAAADHNAQHEHDVFQSQGVNLFSDLTLEELRRSRTGHVRRAGTVARARDTPLPEALCPACKLFPDHANYSAASLNWTDKGAVAPVVDQGPCGACWAFASTADVEGSHFLATGKLVPLAQQQPVACDHDGELQDSCLGGLGSNMFDYLLGKDEGHTKVRGLVSAKTWPWAHDMGPGDDCKANKDCSKACKQIGDATLVPTCDDGVCMCTPACPASKESGPYAATIDGWSWVSQSAKQEAKMVDALARFGPLDVALDAGGIAGYVPGTVIKPTKKMCDAANVDHEVLVVGYGTLKGVDYWLVKNSWSTNYGEQGYFRIQRGVNACGIATDVATSYKNSSSL